MNKDKKRSIEVSKIRSVIRYDRSGLSKISVKNELHLHGESGSIEDKFRCNIIATSLNPFLQGYFDWSSMGGELSTPYLVNFDELASACSGVIFFTYFTDINETNGKFMIKNYPHPACFKEMEIRFMFNKQQEFQCQKGINLNQLEWSGILQLAETVKDSMDLSPLNLLKFDTTMGNETGEKFADIIKIIKEYDSKIIKIFEQM